jgi:dihydrolipoamide dehydrogenase
MEPEISEVLTKKMKELGCEIIFEADIEKTEGRFAYISTPNGKKQIEFDKLLVTAGRVLNFDELGLEKTKVKIDAEGRIVVDSAMRTNDVDIFAVGDIVFGPELAHKAFRQGKVAAEVIAGQKSAFDVAAIPSIVFSEPEIGMVGMTEEEATKAGYKVKIGKMPFTASGRAKTINKTEGFVKIIADEHGVVRGVHAIGEGVEAIIAEGALAIEMGATLDDLALTIQTHPTISESLPEAAEQALGKAIHLYKGKK